MNKLDDEEKEIFESFEKGELESVGDPNRLAQLQRKARLEVSGIRRGSGSIVKSRVKMKLEQISPSDTLSSGYVCVVEFGTPRTRVVEKCKT